MFGKVLLIMVKRILLTNIPRITRAAFHFNERDIDLKKNLVGSIPDINYSAVNSFKIEEAT